MSHCERVFEGCCWGSCECQCERCMGMYPKFPPMPAPPSVFEMLIEMQQSFMVNNIPPPSALTLPRETFERLFGEARRWVVASFEHNGIITSLHLALPYGTLVVLRGE